MCPNIRPFLWALHFNVQLPTWYSTRMNRFINDLFKTEKLIFFPNLFLPWFSPSLSSWDQTPKVLFDYVISPPSTFPLQVLLILNFKIILKSTQCFLSLLLLLWSKIPSHLLTIAKLFNWLFCSNLALHLSCHSIFHLITKLIYLRYKLDYVTTLLKNLTVPFCCSQTKVHSPHNKLQNT